MRKFIVFLSLIGIVAPFTGTAHADSIEGRFGITAQAGAIVPVNSRYSNQFATASGITDTKLKGDTSFAGGGGLIYGVTRYLALEAQVLYFAPIEYDNADVKAFQLEAVDASLGLQLRNDASEDIAAYLGLGADVLFSEIKDSNGAKGDVDTVVGGHINAGGDYFVTKNIALNIDLRGLFFPETDVKAGGITAVKYDPISFVALFGVRFFLN